MKINQIEPIVGQALHVRVKVDRGVFLDETKYPFGKMMK